VFIDEVSLKKAPVALQSLDLTVIRRSLLRIGRAVTAVFSALASLGKPLLNSLENLALRQPVVAFDARTMNHAADWRVTLAHYDHDGAGRWRQLIFGTPAWPPDQLHHRNPAREPIRGRKSTIASGTASRRQRSHAVVCGVPPVAAMLNAVPAVFVNLKLAGADTPDTAALTV
jgi:hypothetical protein